MNYLPKEEQRVYDELVKAHGKPLRAAEIADRLGIQDNHCVKLIKFLTDKGYLSKDHRRFVEIGGKKKSFKEYWIPIKTSGITQANDLSKDSPERCQVCGSYYRRNGDCNICQNQK